MPAPQPMRSRHRWASRSAPSAERFTNAVLDPSLPVPPLHRSHRVRGWGDGRRIGGMSGDRLTGGVGFGCAGGFGSDAMGHRPASRIKISTSMPANAVPPRNARAGSPWHVLRRPRGPSGARRRTSRRSRPRVRRWRRLPSRWRARQVNGACRCGAQEWRHSNVRLAR